MTALAEQAACSSEAQLVKPRRRIIFALLRTALGIALLAYLGLSGKIHWGALWGLARAWPVTLMAFLILWLVVTLMAWRLALLLKPLGFNLQLSSAVRLTLIGFFFSTFLPGSTGGDLVKFFYAARENPGRRTEVATVILLDRAVGMFAVLLLPLSFAPLFPKLLHSNRFLSSLLWLAALSAAAMLAGLLVCFSSRVSNSRLLLWIFQSLPGGTHLKRIVDTVRAFRHRVGTLIGTTLLALVINLLGTAVILLAGRATNPKGFAWGMVILIPLGSLATSLPVTPGGLGVGEAAFDALYRQAGLTGGGESLLGWRLLRLLIGVFGLVFYLQGRRHFVPATEVVETSSKHPTL